MKETRIAPEVLNVLAGAVVVEGVVSIDQVERKLYLKTNEVLEALGGKWNRKAKGHTFAGVDDVAERLEGVVLTGAFIDPRKAYDLIETPAAFAQELASSFVNIKKGGFILEPSAGNGALVNALLETRADYVVHAVEIQPACVKALEKRFPRTSMIGGRLSIWQGDFMEYEFDRRYDGILMNPPFSKQQDIDHVTYAIDLLDEAPVSVLVAVMSAGVKFRTNAKTVRFRALIDSLGGTIEDNPEGTFSSSGTNVNTVTVTICR